MGIRKLHSSILQTDYLTRRPFLEAASFHEPIHENSALTGLQQPIFANFAPERTGRMDVLFASGKPTYLSIRPFGRQFWWQMLSGSVTLLARSRVVTP
jgi:hypothetical protein